MSWVSVIQGTAQAVTTLITINNCNQKYRNSIQKQNTNKKVTFKHTVLSTSDDWKVIYNINSYLELSRPLGSLVNF